jgi:hypothetical protein
MPLPLSGSWPARITWLPLPLLVGPALGDALDASSRAVQITASALAWGTWAAVLAGVLIPRTVTLTLLRIVAPLALAVALWAGVAGERTGADLLAVGWAAVTLVAAFAPGTGDAFVNGSSYGDERRMPLRVPGSLLLGPLPLTWAAAVAAPVGAPLLLAAEEWVAGIALAALGVPPAVVSVRALHGLSKRWVVFVPAGLVLHDLHALVDPVLFPRARLLRLGPAPAEVEGARDLTQGALGLALELELSQDLELAPRRPDGSLELEPVDRVLFTPTRPGALLQEAARRRLPVG